MGVGVNPRLHLSLRIAAALFSGAILSAIAPPLNLHYLHWFSFLPIFWALKPGDHRRNAWLGYASGWVAQFVIFRWLIDTVRIFTDLPVPLPQLVLCLFATAFALPYGVFFASIQWFRERLGPAWMWVVPAMLVTVEKLSPALFPYYQGVSQYRFMPTWQLASVTGVLGLSYLVMASNTILAETLIYSRAEGRRPPWRSIGVFLALFAANVGFGLWRTSDVEARLATAPTLQVALLQDDVTMEERRFTSAKEDLFGWVKLTNQLKGQKMDLVVWPEGAVPYNPTDTGVKKLLGNMASAGGYDLLVGGGTSEKAPPESGRQRANYNSCYLFDKEGEIRGRYDKMVPLPFGEYIPFSDTFPFLKDLIEGPGDFRAGTAPTVFQGSGYTFTVPICYEAILSSQMWKLKDADLFVNITNDAWFGDTAAPHQHAMLAAVQAMQLGRPLLRVAYTGIDFVVEPTGKILYETQPFTEVAKVVPLRLLPVDTIYRHGGWIFPWLCVVATAVAVVRGRRRAPQS